MSTWHPLTGRRVEVILIGGESHAGVLKAAIDGWVTVWIEVYGQPEATVSFPDARVAEIRDKGEVRR